MCDKWGNIQYRSEKTELSIKERAIYAGKIKEVEIILNKRVADAKALEALEENKPLPIPPVVPGELPIPPKPVIEEEDLKNSGQ